MDPRVKPAGDAENVTSWFGTRLLHSQRDLLRLTSLGRWL